MRQTYTPFHYKFVSIFLLVFPRHAPAHVLPAYRILGAEHVRHLLHPRRPRALQYRRVHRLLHHLADVPLLPHPRQQPGALPAGLVGHQNLVPNVQVGIFQLMKLDFSVNLNFTDYFFLAFFYTRRKRSVYFYRSLRPSVTTF